jgi:hypothetical protein
MMNCIIEVQSGSSQYVRRSWANVLESIGYKCHFYNIEADSINDIFNRVGNVNLLLGTTYNLNRTIVKQIHSRPEMKVALYCSGFGKLCDEIDLKKYPIQVVSEEEKKWVEQIKERISCCHIHIQDNLVGDYIGGWTSTFGIPTIGMMNGADLFTYWDAKSDEKYAADLSFVGGMWPYKGRNLDKLVRLCREQWRNINIKIYGQGGWDVPQWLGAIDWSEDAKVFASSKVCPNFSEPHSTESPINDLVERIFKVPAAGGFLICDDVDLSHTGLETYVPQFTDYNGFLETIEYYLKPGHEKVRQSLMLRQKEIVWDKHTYFERIGKLLSIIGLEQDSKKCFNKKTELFPLCV